MDFSLEVLRKAIKGDERAVATVINQYTPLVHQMVNKYEFMSHGHSHEDLVQEGFIGIHTALQTYDESIELTLSSWMTWVFWKVRFCVQSAARKEHKHDKYAIPIDSSGEILSDAGFFQPSLLCNNPDNIGTFDYEGNNGVPSIKNIILDGCGSLESKRAKIVCSRFGLLGHKPLRNSEVAKKFGLSKQSVTGYIARFSKAIRKRHPELADLVKP